MDLGHLAGDCYSRAWGINSRGQVVGNSLLCEHSKSLQEITPFHHSFLWEDGNLVDLNSLIPPSSPLELVGMGPLSYVLVPNINDRGEIVGIGVPPGRMPESARRGQRLDLCGHAFLLIPCDKIHLNIEGCDYGLVDANAVSNTASIVHNAASAHAKPPNPASVTK
jgi:probable HAF family extracellular repeat protein